MLELALARLQDCQCRSLPVVRGGSVVGVLTMDNVSELLMIQSVLERGPSGGGRLAARPVG